MAKLAEAEPFARTEYVFSFSHITFSVSGSTTCSFTLPVTSLFDVLKTSVEICPLSFSRKKRGTFGWTIMVLEATASASTRALCMQVS